jgi:hypothetical protein
VFQSEHINDLRLYVQNVPVGTLERFYRNTVEISENSENHLKAIVAWGQATEADRVGQVPKCRHENRGAKEKRGKTANETGTRSLRMLIDELACDPLVFPSPGPEGMGSR